MSGTSGDAPRSLGFRPLSSSLPEFHLRAEIDDRCPFTLGICTHGKYEPMKDAHSLWFRCPR